MWYNLNAGYWRVTSNSITPSTAWKVFYVTAAWWAGDFLPPNLPDSIYLLSKELIDLILVVFDI